MMQPSKNYTIRLEKGEKIMRYKMSPLMKLVYCVDMKTYILSATGLVIITECFLQLLHASIMRQIICSVGIMFLSLAMAARR